MSVNIAIDGPAGAGKSTVAKMAAKELGFIYVDTGAMYRAMALYFLRQGIGPDERERIEEGCEDVDITIDYVNREQIVFLNGENVTGLIRTEEVGNMASASSAVPKVREKLVALQQRLAQKRDVVMDGRDIGTVVLPDASVKIYLTADASVRAKRRYDELAAKGMQADLSEIEKDIIERDERDMTREASPLRRAGDAILIDSSDLTIPQVVEKIVCLAGAVTGTGE